MTTLTLNKKSVAYNAARTWADGFDPMMNQIAFNIIASDPKLMDIHFIQASSYEDRKLGIDKRISMSDSRLSYRIRDHSYMRYALEGFTIRTSGPQPELWKIQNEPNFADFLLYAIADEKEYGQVAAAVLVDLKVLGAYLKTHPEAIEKAHKGQGFIEFKYDDLPKEVVAGLWNLTKKGEVSCQ